MKPLNLLMGLAVLALFITPAPAQTMATNADGVTFHFPFGTMKIKVCAERIFRVCAAPTHTLPPAEDFVVTHHWKPVPFKISETTNAVVIATKLLQARVQRSSGAITFLNAAGKILLQEPAAGGKKFTPIPGKTLYQVEQKFICQPDEFLYGLGQYQEGLWNWRGLPRELLQHNTTCTMPVLVSSRGYGLLWDNASLTDFNPLPDEVPLQREAASGSNQTSSAKSPTIHSWHGTYTTGAAGEYVFFAKSDKNRKAFSITVNGREIAGITNYWTPRSLCGTIHLPAHKICRILVRGGGTVSLSAGLRLNTTTLRSQLGRMLDYTFFYGPKLDQVIRGYRLATGEAPMWPEWAFGFWQCRERYHNQKELLAAATEYRHRHIPLDLIVQDWRYWTNHSWGSYEFDRSRYPHPAGMIRQLHDEHVKFMISVWSNPRGATRAELEQHHALIGKWIDVFNPVGRAIRWKHINQNMFQIGVDAWWGDATEPGDDGNGLKDRQTFMGSGNLLRNAYSLFASESLYNGQRSETSTKRVCILSRSSFPGIQRYASAVWSGDISGNWVTFRRQIPAGLNFCLAGVPYWTTDCGGFWRPADQYTSPDYNELLARWFEWSTFCPVQRMHGGNTRTEFWNWLPATQKILIAYDNLRHRLLPYIYSDAWQVTHNGGTMMRALAFDFPNDRRALAIGDEYLFGPDLLVAPVTKPEATNKTVYLPAGTSWVNFWTGKQRGGGDSIQTVAPLNRIPIFARAGSILPIGPLEQYAGEKPADPLELRIYRGADGSFTLYEDEGDNYDYEKGIYATIRFTWNETKHTLTIGRRQGHFPGMLKKREFDLVFVGPNHGVGGSTTSKPDVKVHYTGKEVTVSTP